MKTALLTSLLLIFTLLVGCDSNDQSDNNNNNDIVTFAGTVEFKDLEGGFFAIDADDGQGYDPINLPAELSVDGLRVQVTARIRNDMASIRMYGIIIEITEIATIP